MCAFEFWIIGWLRNAISYEPFIRVKYYGLRDNILWKINGRIKARVLKIQKHHAHKRKLSCRAKRENSNLGSGGRVKIAPRVYCQKLIKHADLIALLRHTHTQHTSFAVEYIVYLHFYRDILLIYILFTVSSPIYTLYVQFLWIFSLQRVLYPERERERYFLAALYRRYSCNCLARKRSF